MESNFYLYGKLEKLRLLLKKYDILDISMDDYVTYLIKNILDMLKDQYAEYYNPGEMDLLYNEYVMKYAMENGLVIQKENNGNKIVLCSKGGEAYKCGLREGDVIERVDEKNIENENMIKIYSMLSEENTKIEVIRNGKCLHYDVKKLNKLDENTKKCTGTKQVQKEQKQNWLYLKIGMFGNYVLEEVEKAIEETKCKDLILDLRDNGGGQISHSIGVAELLLKYDSIICNIIHADYKEEKRVTKQNNRSFNIHVLVNEKTGSAAELLTAAIKENGGKIYGEKTYGKGKIQLIFPFDKFDGSGVKITVAEIQTANNEKIEGVGVEVTEYVENIDDYKNLDDIIEMITLFNDKEHTE